ncbi:hypothetical protein Tco_0746786 [Tanacetum coccineum]
MLVVARLECEVGLNIRMPCIGKCSKARCSVECHCAGVNVYIYLVVHRIKWVKLVRWWDTKKPDTDTEKRTSWGRKTAKVDKRRVMITPILDV